MAPATRARAEDLAKKRYPIYVIAEMSIEPMHVLPPGPGQEATSWFRYMDRYGPRVHNMAFYVDDLEIRLDVAKTWGCEYRFTDRVLVGDPRVQG